MVVISHGLGEHALRYERFAQTLNEAGFRVYAPDHRAHGKTSGPAGLGDFGTGGWDALIDDLDYLLDHAATCNPGLPIVLFAHSMGAAAAQQLMPISANKVNALILSGSTLRKPGQPIPDYNLQFEPTRTAYD